MAITQYTKPAEAPIMDMYVPIPFQEMMQAGMMKQARYEEAVAMEDQAMDALTKFRGLGDIRIGGHTVNIGDDKVVEEIIADYRNKISQLSAAGLDKSDPTYRGKIKSLLTSIRQDAGPTGRLGRALGNVEAYQKFQEEVAKRPDIMHSPHLLLGQLQRAQGLQRREGIADLDLTGPIGEYVDINKELMPALKNLGERFLGESVQKYTDIPGLYRALRKEGVTAKDIQEATISHISTSPHLLRDIQSQAAYAQMQGQDVTPEQIATGHVQNMINLFEKEEIKTTQIKDWRAKEKWQQQQEIDNRIEGKMALGKKGLGLETGWFTNTREALVGKLDASTEALADRESKLNTLMSQKGIRTNPKGQYVYDNGTAVSHEDYLAIERYTKEAQGAKETLQTFRNLHNKAATESGFDPEQAVKNTSDYQRMMSDFDTHYLAFRNANTGKIAEWKREGAKTLGDDPAILDQYAQQKYQEFATEEIIGRLGTLGRLDTESREFREGYKKYKNALETYGDDTSYTANIKGFTKSMQSQVDDFVRDYYSDPDQMVSGVVIAGGEDFGQNLKINKDLWEDLNIDVSKKPRAVGMTLDEDSGGEPKMIVNYYDKEGKSITVKVDPPDNLVRNMFTRGDTDMFNYTMNAKLNSKLGAFRDYNDEQDITLGLEKGEGPKVRVKMPTNTNPMIELYDASGLVERFNNKSQLRAYLAGLSQEYYMNKTK
jgi:hypothetical protein